MKILDAGCGIHKYKGEEGDRVIGVDFINNKYADVTHDLNKFPWPFRDNEFDMVNCVAVLEHLNEPIKVLEEFWRITKPEGRIFISVPHYSGLCSAAHVEHKHIFASNSLMYFEDKSEAKVSSSARFRVKSELGWLTGFTRAKHNSIREFVIILTALVEWPINLNYYTKLLAERFLCFYIGGFDEVRFYLEVVK